MATEPRPSCKKTSGACAGAPELPTRCTSSATPSITVCSIARCYGNAASAGLHWRTPTHRPSPVLQLRQFAVFVGLAASLFASAQTPPAPARPAAAPAPAATPAIAGLSAPVFVLNSQDADVSVIDASGGDWKVVRRIASGKEPHHLYMTPDEKSVIVANAQSDTLTFIDPRTAEVQRTVRGIIDPYHLRFSPDMKWFVTAANRLDHVDLYRWDGKDLQLARRIPTGKTPSHIWIDSRSTTAFVTMQDSDELVAIDLATQALKWRAKTGPMPADVFGTADDRFLLVGMTGGDHVEVWDLTGPQPRVTRRIKTGAGAHAFRSAGDRRHVYVSNRVANTISKIDLQSLEVVDTLPAPGGPDCMELVAGGRLLLVTSRWARRLTVIDTQTRQVVRQVAVGKSPHGVWTLDHVRH
ncbi:beta-propeller fold lactonase family protein [Ramlibacter sp. AW1]|uniref:Beta-propeller fold lactonase family protein n=1 Tax=Ramlibacter aurantiacus TaxID=2801330 RepID=A0A936ZT72_9BURK|nr:beta-propeller fold lactonase family protein [Ramlibacter aurantiacus]